MSSVGPGTLDDDERRFRQSGRVGRHPPAAAPSAITSQPVTTAEEDVPHWRREQPRHPRGFTADHGKTYRSPCMPVSSGDLRETELVQWVGLGWGREEVSCEVGRPRRKRSILSPKRHAYRDD